MHYTIQKLRVSIIFILFYFILLENKLILLFSKDGLNCAKVKSSHLYLYSAFNNTDCVKALNSIKLEDRVSEMYNNKIKHSIFS